MAFTVLFLLLLKPPASCYKKNLNEFVLHSTSIFMSQILKILFQTEDINIFVLCGVFLVHMFN